MKMTLIVRGKTQEWNFVVNDARMKYLDDYRADGLDISPLNNEVHQWIPAWLDKLWYWIQDFICKQVSD